MMKHLTPLTASRTHHLLVLPLCAVIFGMLPQLVSAQRGGILGGGRESRGPATAHVSAALVADTVAIESGKPFRLGVLFTMEDQWHIYWHTPGESGLPTEIAWRLPEGFVAGPLQWPTPEDFNDGGFKSKGYGHEVLLFSTVTPPADIKSEAITFEASTSWLVCKADGSCIPGDTELTLTIARGAAEASEHAATFDKYAALVPAEDSGATPNAASTPEPTPEIEPSGKPSGDAPPKTKGEIFSFLSNDWNKEKVQSAWLMLIYAFLGGLILNIMPCVLPVLSIKVLSFVRQADQDPKRIFRLGLAFTGGVFASFFALALVVVVLRTAGGQVGWGFQMQEPRFVILMSAIVLAFAMSLFGVFEIELPGAALQNVEGLQYKEGPAGAFFNGVLATALATPCTAPLLGPAIGFAFTQSSLMIFVFFSAIAMGLALPYLLLSAQPQWMKYMPKPGNWMNTFKQFMGFLLVATVVWLLSVLGSQTGAEGVIWALAFLTCVALACWIYGIGFDLRAKRNRKIVSSIFVIILLTNGYYYFAERNIRALEISGLDPEATAPGETTAETIEWQPFSVELVEKTAAEGKTMLLDFTADWCVTCKFNEKTALASSEVVDAIKSDGVVAIKADWTKRDPLIGDVLQLFGRSGVPLYVIFPGGRPGEPILLPDGYLSKSEVLEALKAAK